MEYFVYFEFYELKSWVKRSANNRRRINQWLLKGRLLYKTYQEEITVKTYTVAILGATGAVGQEMINILQGRNFPVGKLIPLASARSAGKTLKSKGEDVTIQLACDEAFEGVDIVLGAAAAAL